MPSFRSAKSQASHAVQQKTAHGTSRHDNKGDGRVHSIGTERSYTQALKGAQEWLKENRLGNLRQLSSEKAAQYLEMRAEVVSQKTLDLDRQALQLHLGERLERVQSQVQSPALGVETRSYSPEQIREVASHQSERYSLATAIAHNAGLRASELLTLRPAQERAASAHREWSTHRFEGREGSLYTVVGKGGLVREVLLRTDLAERLEARRLSAPETVRDRGINRERIYDLAGGKKWSEDFGRASREALGYSTGGHGLRHSYAQERESELQSRGYTQEEARGLVAQEVGHFDENTTRAYER